MSNPTEEVFVRRAGEGSPNGAFDFSRIFIIESEASGGALSQWIENAPA